MNDKDWHPVYFPISGRSIIPLKWNKTCWHVKDYLPKALYHFQKIALTVLKVDILVTFSVRKISQVKQRQNGEHQCTLNLHCARWMTTQWLILEPLLDAQPWHGNEMNTVFFYIVSNTHFNTPSTFSVGLFLPCPLQSGYWTFHWWACKFSSLIFSNVDSVIIHLGFAHVSWIEGINQGVQVSSVFESFPGRSYPQFLAVTVLVHLVHGRFSMMLMKTKDIHPLTSSLQLSSLREECGGGL